MKIRSILVIKGASNYSSVSEFANAIIEEWKKKYVVEVLDGSDFYKYYEKKEEILRGKTYDVVFSFNALPLEEEPELVEYLLTGDTVYCTWLLDHPLHHHSRLLEIRSKCLVLVPDYNHMTYLDRYYPDIPYVGFLPHGGSTFEKRVPYRERKIPVSFLGSYTSSQSIKKKLEDKNEIVQVLQEELMNQLQLHPWWTIEQAFFHMIDLYDLEESPEEISNDLAVLKDADLYIRSYYREQVLQTILNAGIPVHIYGDNWGNFSCREKELLKIHPPCNYEKAIEITSNSKISLNVMPWFKAGSHERVFNALGCGAIALTDHSEYFEKLENQDGIKMYDLTQLEKLPDMLREILAEDIHSEQFAMAGYQNGIKNHLWANRAEEILSYIEQLE